MVLDIFTTAEELEAHSGQHTLKVQFALACPAQGSTIDSSFCGAAPCSTPIFAGKPSAHAMPRAIISSSSPCAPPASIAGRAVRRGGHGATTSAFMPPRRAPKRRGFARARAAACRLLVEPDKTPSLAQLAARIGLSPSHLARAFKARTGLTPKAWANAQRRAHLEAGLAQADSVLDAALAAGYSDTRALYQQRDGLSPAQRRRQAAGETLRYAIAACPLGQLLLASSARGVCALLFGDSPEELESELRQRFAAARLQRDDAGLGDWLRQVIGQIEEPQRATQLPLDLHGTVFQHQVWRALQQIPAGQTRRYGELAASIGSHPRAVARGRAGQT